MSLTPSKAEVMKRIGFTPENYKEKALEFVAALRPVEAEIQRLLDENDLDFPDKV